MDWLSYRLSDLILFSPQTYYRMFAQFHGLIWPGQVAVVASALMVPVLLWKGHFLRVAMLVMAAWCILVAIAFHANRYATINWAAKYFALLFVVQALALLWAARTYRARRPLSRFHGVVAAILFGFALGAPLFSRAAGRDWNQVELIGATPDPTAIATLALALLLPAKRWMLAAVPLVWCVIGAATLWALHSPEAWIPIVCSALAIAALLTRIR
jgi:hypothetical protein